MKLYIFTIALDAMPQITWHLPAFNWLTIPWHWYIVEGAAMNEADTGWCKPQMARLSKDGTTEYLNSLRGHPCVTVVQKQRWHGKTEQCNACLKNIKEPCVLMQIDCDELWSSEQLNRVVQLFEENPQVAQARFYCRYFVGPNLVVTSDNTYGNHNGEWLRAWRFSPGDFFLRHEPPTLQQQFHGDTVDRSETRSFGMVFDHYAYVFESQVAYKEKFYGYTDAVHRWKRLQQNAVWPADLNQFFNWAKDGTVDLLHK
jgi:hypothetical protein